MPDSLALIKTQINNLDFSLIEKKLRMQGWKQRQLNKVIPQYKNMLFLWKKYNTHYTLPPTTDIDEVWHTHILDTKAYARDCNMIFGEYLHHYPYFGIDDKTDRNDLNNAFEKTMELYYKEFGEELLNVRIQLLRTLKIALKTLNKKLFSRRQKVSQPTT